MPGLRRHGRRDACRPRPRRRQHAQDAAHLHLASPPLPLPSKPSRPGAAPKGPRHRRPSLSRSSPVDIVALDLCRFIDGFSNHIRSSVQNTIKNKVMEGALKLDSFLESLPKKIDLDSVAAMNVTFVNDPLFKSSSVEFDIDGLFIPSDETAPSDMLLGDTQFALPLGSSSKCFGFHWMKMF